MSRQPALVALLCLALAGCHESGTWIDDPENLERAWGERPPGDLQVLHSWYRRSAHFTREEAYYFHFAPNRRAMRDFIAANNLESFPDEMNVNMENFGCFARPGWFAPKARQAYKVSLSAPDAPRALVVEDRATGEFFVSACQM